ncbi:MAG: hypothetical protein KJ023_03490 [Burkholderiaceae bacterium]|nr:hypothetical protein [Burkholderiaceae bacterium]
MPLSVDSAEADMSCRVVWEPTGVHRVFADRTDCGEFLVSLREVYGDRRFDCVRYVINDFSACTDLSVDMEVIREMAAMDSAASHSNPHIRIAIVGVSELIQAGIAAYAGVALSPYPVKLVATLDEARRWLTEPAGRA